MEIHDKRDLTKSISSRLVGWRFIYYYRHVCYISMCIIQEYVTMTGLVTEYAIGSCGARLVQIAIVQLCSWLSEISCSIFCLQFPKKLHQRIKPSRRRKSSRRKRKSSSRRKAKKSKQVLLPTKQVSFQADEGQRSRSQFCCRRSKLGSARST
jgi:hypothetical protein